MQLVGMLLAVLGTALIVLAALQAAALFGDSIPPALLIGVAGAVSLALGGWLMLRPRRPYAARPRW